MRAGAALSRSRKARILIHMEDFSTPRRPLVPMVANLATAAVLLTATWMSTVQRPHAEGLPLASRDAKSVPTASRITDRATDRSTDGNRTKAARMLGISLRNLMYKLKELNIS